MLEREKQKTRNYITEDIIHIPQVILDDFPICHTLRNHLSFLKIL